MIRLLLLLMIGCTPQAWSKTDTAMQMAAMTALSLDYVQTVSITNDSLESNRLIGASGERIPPTVYFTSVIVLHFLAAASLPPVMRKLLSAAVIGVGVHSVHHNHIHGYRLW